MCLLFDFGLGLGTLTRACQYIVSGCCNRYQIFKRNITFCLGVNSKVHRDSPDTICGFFQLGEQDLVLQLQLRFSLNENTIFVIRSVNGEYTGRDSTNIKLIFSQVIYNLRRKKTYSKAKSKLFLMIFIHDMIIIFQKSLLESNRKFSKL